MYDDAIYRGKIQALTSPAFREEIDLCYQKGEQVRKQLQFDTFKGWLHVRFWKKVMCCTKPESFLMNQKTLLKNFGVSEKLGDLEKNAHMFRKNAEQYLLRANPGRVEKRALYLSIRTKNLKNLM